MDFVALTCHACLGEIQPAYLGHRRRIFCALSTGSSDLYGQRRARILASAAAAAPCPCVPLIVSGAPPRIARPAAAAQPVQRTSRRRRSGRLATRRRRRRCGAGRVGLDLRRSGRGPLAAHPPAGGWAGGAGCARWTGTAACPPLARPAGMLRRGDSEGSAAAGRWRDVLDWVDGGGRGPTAVGPPSPAH